MFEPQPPDASRRGVDAGAFGDVSGVLLAHLLGPALADLDAIPDSVDGDAQLVDLAVGLSRLEAWAVAQRARVSQALLERTRAELERHGQAAHRDSRATSAGASHRYDDERLAERTVSTDLSLALGITPWAADRELDLGAGLARHDELAVAMAAGRLDRRRVEVVLDELAGLADPTARQQVIAKVVGDGSHSAERPERRAGLIRPLRTPDSHLHLLQPATLRRAVRHECARLDPDLFATREAAARAGRRVELSPLPDCMAELRIVAPGYVVAAAFTNVDLAARTCRRRGDGRTLEQLRCDITVGWLTEGAFGTLVTRPPVEGPATSGSARTGSATTTTAGTQAGSALEQALLQASGLTASRSTTPTYVDDDRFRVQLPRPRGALIVISMPDRTALGLDDQPATLHGPGGPSPLPAPLGRRIAYDPTQSTWLGLYTDPRTGVATDISPGYRSPPRQRTFVMLRDGMRSRLPSSNIRRVELDHVVPYDHEHPSRGGQTTAAGLACAGLREHHLKTDGLLSVTGDANAALTYTTHTEHTYVSWPEVWDDPPTYVDVAHHKDAAIATQDRAQAGPDPGDPPY